MTAPLEGIRILDFTQYQNGPHATVMLSDMGAEVIKVERPGAGDPGRTLGKQPDGFCGYFEGHSRGKLSVTVELGKPEGLEVIRRLLPTVDVVTANFKAGVMEHLGLSYEAVRAVNPRIIYAVNTGFGPEGEWAPRGSFDIVAQGMSGAMIGQAGGPGAEPENIAFGVADQTGSIVFAYGIMSALLARERFGVGQRVDCSLLGAMTTLQSSMITNFMHTGVQPRRLSRAVNPVFTYYQAGDGEWFTMGALAPKQWTSLCVAIDRIDLLTDERSEDPFARDTNRDWLMDELAEVFRAQPRNYWLERMIECAVPCGPCYDYAGVVGDRQFWDNGYLIDLPHPRFESHRVVGIPVRLSETPGRVQSAAPELGEHTDQVLQAAGYSATELEELRRCGVI